MKFKRLVLAILSLSSYSAFAATQFQEFNPNLHEKIDDKYAIKNQLLVAYQTHSESSIKQFSNIIKKVGLNVSDSEVISTDQSNLKIIKLNLRNQRSLTSLRESIQNLPNVKWVQPNYIYNIGQDPREEITNDPMINNQYHHQLMNNLKAWDIATGKNIVIAITDDGFDTQHEDLAAQFYPGKGYNFCDNNSNVNPSSTYEDHGTHVAGIAAAEMNNNKGGSGVAGHATILPIKFYSSSCRWTSELIYKSYQYAVDNGAKIISTSYNIDQFVGDKVFVAGLDYAYQKGVLQFNSAGNGYTKNPTRQAFEELILVASTNEQDVKSDYSNYGYRVQISAPGENILSTVPGNRYETMSGTSMATPNAAGSAALIWSMHPTWNRDQVAAQLIGTADNIDNKNPQYKGMLGSGRVNNYRALTENVTSPKITTVDMTSTSVKGNEKDIKLAIHFDKVLDPNVVNKGNHWEVKSLTSNSLINTSMDHPWFIGSTTLTLSMSALTPGKYQLTVKDSLKDPFGQALDGDANGNAGGNYVYVFEVK